MSVFRINKNKGYTTISNYHLQDKNLSLKAKGLLSVMLSLPKDWNYTIEGLVALCKENESAISSTLNELKQFGYLDVIKLFPNQTESGRIEYIYDIFEKPKQAGEKQALEIQGLEIQEVENLGLYKYTNKQNTNNNNILDKKSSKILEKNIKKSAELLEKTKKLTNKEKLFSKLKNEILVKSKLYQKEEIRDLLVRWLNALFEINKLPSSNSLEDSLMELEKFNDDEIIEAVNNSIKSGYARFFPKKIQKVSADGINLERKLTDYEIQKMEESEKYIREKYGK